VLFRSGGEAVVTPDAAILALGGASWPRLGSDGSWAEPLAQAGVAITPLAPSNCGVAINWSEPFAKRFAGQPLKRISVRVGDQTRRGEAMITESGIEGGVIYALGPALRRQLRHGAPTLHIDLRPDMELAAVADRLKRPRGGQSLSTYLRKALRLDSQAIGLLRETGVPDGEDALAHRIKNIEIAVTGLAGLDRAISTIGGVAAEALDHGFMLRARPGVFVAGEMLDWDAPTGGYLIHGALATGHAAAEGALVWLQSRQPA
jgi:uncharacterized flavoprotein (TIGR03862 family)